MNAILVLVVAVSIGGSPNLTKAQAAVKRQQEIDLAYGRHNAEMPEFDRLIGKGTKYVGHDLRPEYMQYPGDPRPRQVMHLKLVREGRRYDYVLPADKVCYPKPRAYEAKYSVKVLRPYEFVDNVPGSHGQPVKADELPKSKASPLPQR